MENKNKLDTNFLNDLKQTYNEIDIPDSISPVNMIKIIEKEGDIERNKSKIAYRKKKKRTILFSAFSIAAVILLSIGIGLGYLGLYGASKDANGNYIISMNELANNEDENGFSSLKSYDALEKYLKRQSKLDKLNEILNNNDIKLEDDMGLNESVTDSLTNNPNKDFSTTNVRTEGVNEGDMILTDGQYIFIANKKNGIVHVLSGEGKDSKLLKSIPVTIQGKTWLEGDAYYLLDEMYLDGNKLVVIYTASIADKDAIMSEGCYYEDYIQADYCLEVKTIVHTYDFLDINNVQLIGDIAIDGVYDSSRMVDGCLYVYTSMKINIDTKVIPQVCNNSISESKVFIDKDSKLSHYIIMASLNIDNPNTVIDNIAYATDSSCEYYVSNSSVYIYKLKFNANYYIYEDDYEDTVSNTSNPTLYTTKINKFEYGDGIIIAKNTVTVDGYLDDSFCIDEYNGYLRMILTGIGSGGNALVILDENLSETGRIDDIAPGESVYSALFMGDIGYFVTFYQTDPLFSVDLSNPNAPKIIGALKIPGFSEYMHYWKDNLILGFGMDNGEIKLSLFDINDNTNVLETDKTILTDIFYSPVIYDYKKLLINADNNIIGFCAYGYYGCNGSYEEIRLDEKNMYYIFGVNNNKIVKKAEIDIKDLIGVNDYAQCDARGIYVGDTLYIIIPNGYIGIYDINTFEFLGKIYPK